MPVHTLHTQKSLFDFSFKGHLPHAGTIFEAKGVCLRKLLHHVFIWLRFQIWQPHIMNIGTHVYGAPHTKYSPT